MKDKIPFNYKMYRWACISAWIFFALLFVITIFLPITLEEAEFTGYLIGAVVMITILGFGAFGIIAEIVIWFKKVKEKQE